MLIMIMMMMNLKMMMTAMMMTKLKMSVVIGDISPACLAFCNRRENSLQKEPVRERILNRKNPLEEESVRRKIC